MSIKSLEDSALHSVIDDDVDSFRRSSADSNSPSAAKPINKGVSPKSRGSDGSVTPPVDTAKSPAQNSVSPSEKKLPTSESGNKKEAKAPASKEKENKEAKKPPQPSGGKKISRSSSTNEKKIEKKPSDSDDDDTDAFVRIITSKAVSSTSEAVTEIKRLQGTDTSQNQNSVSKEILFGEPGVTETEKPVKQLPSTLKEFFESPKYVVALKVKKTALVEDAISGFQSYARREEEEFYASVRKHLKRINDLNQERVKQSKMQVSTAGGLFRMVPVMEDGDNASAMFLKRDLDRAALHGGKKAGEHAASRPADKHPEELNDKATVESQYQAFLQEKIFAHAMIPEVFRFKYPPQFDAEKLVSPYERELETQRRRLKHLHPTAPEWPLEERSHPNELRKEWLFVWDQFKRDLPRETMYIEKRQCLDPAETVAAIHSFLEFSFNRGRTKILNDKKNAEKAAQSSETSALQAFFRAGNKVLKDAVTHASGALPNVLGNTLLNAAGVNSVDYRAYPDDKKEQGKIIFQAVREVVLASQQSFMGFPYQLLCEQVGGLELTLETSESETDEAENIESTPLKISVPPPLESPEVSMTNSSFGSRTTRVLRTYRVSSPLFAGDVEGGKESAFEEKAEKRDGVIVTEVPSEPPQHVDPENAPPPPIVVPPTVTPPTPTSTGEKKSRNEKMRQRLLNAPLLVGEPPARELECLIDIIRENVKAYQRKMTQKISLDEKLSQEKKEELIVEINTQVFWPDVDGSAFLLCPEEEEKGEKDGSDACRGMRIHLFFDKRQNCPVLFVNKVFRLFAQPQMNRTANILEKTLLLLIQIQFPLFKEQEAEVRWRWWSV
ncbi:hypothetical protein ADEAN_000438600 [Angomonas deanei]|uniref:Uncharacterized protein n=1 Tax=Angomonas deanei TaxID=59799 RepID=A0A7G2CAW6_9TRYP|nr:hypothetical protein ADEAN_000438600 [Angomonas deanei]